MPAKYTYHLTGHMNYVISEFCNISCCRGFLFVSACFSWPEHIKTLSLFIHSVMNTTLKTLYNVHSKHFFYIK